MGTIRKTHPAAFKAKVALEAAKQEKTISQLSSDFGVHSNMITKWKSHLLKELPGIFANGRTNKDKKNQKVIEELYKQIGQLKVELDWLKKKLNSCIDWKKKCIQPEHPQIPVVRQCELLDFSRSAYYYESRGISDYNKLLMRLIDEEHTKYPFYGVLRLTAWLQRNGHMVNLKRIRRLMRLMDIAAVYPKPKLSKPSKEHEIYPYLLKGVNITRPNQVWCTDITYIRTVHGFVYLVAVMDWFSRYVLSHEISNTMDNRFCINALNKALEISKPEIFNSDQGSQFTSNDFTSCLKNNKIAISMDGRGRFYDNIFIERLWRSVKYEKVYLNEYITVKDVVIGIADYFDYYNNQRLHQALGDKYPAELYFKKHN
ncbi:MAG: IS3 family transposase [Desulfobacterales bacterium]|nr:IS3 family transposase [Desulfobacterales bacterium]